MAGLDSIIPRLFESLPSFNSNTPTGEDLEQWLDDLTLCADRLSGGNQADFKFLVKAKLHGAEPREWLDTLALTELSPDDFKEAFKLKWRPTYHGGNDPIYAFATAVQRPAESVMSFAKRLDALARMANIHGADAQLERFVRGLNPDLRRPVQEHRPRTLAEAKDYCHYLETLKPCTERRQPLDPAPNKRYDNPRPPYDNPRPPYIPRNDPPSKAYNKPPPADRRPQENRPPPSPPFPQENMAQQMQELSKGLRDLKLALMEPQSVNFVSFEQSPEPVAHGDVMAADDDSMELYHNDIYSVKRPAEDRLIDKRSKRPLSEYPAGRAPGARPADVAGPSHVAAPPSAPPVQRTPIAPRRSALRPTAPLVAANYEQQKKIVSQALAHEWVSKIKFNVQGPQAPFVDMKVVMNEMFKLMCPEVLRDRTAPAAAATATADPEVVAMDVNAAIPAHMVDEPFFKPTDIAIPNPGTLRAEALLHTPRGQFRLVVTTDSGAAGTVVSYQLLRRIGVTKLIKSSDIVYTSANGQQSKSLGEIDLVLQMGPVSLPVTAQITAATQYNMLVGNDFLLPARAIINYRDQCLELEGDGGEVAVLPLDCSGQRHIITFVDMAESTEMTTAASPSVVVPPEPEELPKAEELAPPAADDIIDLTADSGDDKLPTIGDFLDMTADSDDDEPPELVSDTDDSSSESSDTSDDDNDYDPTESKGPCSPATIVWSGPDLQWSTDDDDFVEQLSTEAVKEFAAVDSQPSVTQPSTSEVADEAGYMDGHSFLEYQLEDGEDKLLYTPQSVVPIQVVDFDTLANPKDIAGPGEVWVPVDCDRNVPLFKWYESTAALAPLTWRDWCGAATTYQVYNHDRSGTPDEHFAKLLSLVKINPDLNPDYRSKVEQLLRKHLSAFALEKSALSEHRGVEHTIETGNAAPIHLQPHRISWAEKKAVEEEVTKLLQQGVIEPSKSAWASPVILVKKKDGSWRFCIDYRRLNKVTVSDIYPLPRIDDLLSETTLGNKWFSSMDADRGFWQVKLSEQDRDKASFITHAGTYRPKVMMMGLKNSPSTYQRDQDQTFAGCKHTRPYVDDMITGSPNL